MRSKQATKSDQQGNKSKRGTQEIHPVWRGVGIFLIVLIPIVGFLLSSIIISSARPDFWIGMPRQLIVPGRDPLLLVKVLLTIPIGAFIYFVLMLVTFIIYRFFGPSTLGPLDVPPINWRRRR